MCMCACTSAST
uniref:Uncharacterized protein n=1 Tax=Anguilla anguilla TaxID=7936 RepID=A0A0E9RT40_ANGAN